MSGSTLFSRSLENTMPMRVMILAHLHFIISSRLELSPEKWQAIGVNPILRKRSNSHDVKSPTTHRTAPGPNRGLNLRAENLLVALLLTQWWTPSSHMTEPTLWSSLTERVISSLSTPSHISCFHQRRPFMGTGGENATFSSGGTEWTDTSCQKIWRNNLKERTSCRPGRADDDVCCPNKETRSSGLIATQWKKGVKLSCPLPWQSTARAL